MLLYNLVSSTRTFIQKDFTDLAPLLFKFSAYYATLKQQQKTLRNESSLLR